MSRFDATWLRIREHADARARDASLLWRLRAALTQSSRQRLSIVDLGSGSGANLRYLAPRLDGRQRWRLVDHDPTLLAAVASFTRQSGMRYDEHRRGQARLSAGARSHARVELHRADLAHLASPDDHIDLVCASALLDLIGGRVLNRILRSCRAVNACVLFTLSYDGRIGLSPADALDARVAELVNQHQRRDKGMGPALGPTAHARAARGLSRLGYRVHRRRSDWELGPCDGSLQRALIDGWCKAASEQRPPLATSLADWRKRRHALVDAGRSRVRVGHVDLLGLPR